MQKGDQKSVRLPPDGKVGVTRPKPNYAAIAREADAAVEHLTDPDLRRVTFEKVLDDLLKRFAR